MALEYQTEENDEDGGFGCFQAQTMGIGWNGCCRDGVWVAGFISWELDVADLVLRWLGQLFDILEKEDKLDLGPRRYIVLERWNSKPKTIYLNTMCQEGHDMRILRGSW